MKTHLILTNRGISEVTIERVCDSDEEKHGVIFRNMAGHVFFCQFHEFAFYIPAKRK